MSEVQTPAHAYDNACPKNILILSRGYDEVYQKKKDMCHNFINESKNSPNLK